MYTQQPYSQAQIYPPGLPTNNHHTRVLHAYYNQSPRQPYPPGQVPIQHQQAYPPATNYVGHGQGNLMPPPPTANGYGHGQAQMQQGYPASNFGHVQHQHGYAYPTSPVHGHGQQMQQNYPGAPPPSYDQVQMQQGGVPPHDGQN